MLVESVGGAEFRNRHFRSAVDNTASGTQALSLAVVTFIFLAAILFLQFVNNVGSMEPYKFFHWLWSYDLGFIKRGLAGTILELFGYGRENIYSKVVIASEILLLVAYLTYAVLACTVVWKKPEWPVFCVALSGAVLQPALPALSFDFGRLDQINLAIYFICCLAMVLGGRRLAGLVLAAGCSVAILVHEAFLIVHLPLCVALLAVRLRTVDEFPLRRIALFLCAVFAVPALTFGAVWFAGAAPVPKDVWVEYWTKKAGFSDNLTLYALNLHYWGLLDSIRATLADLSIARSFFALATIISAVGIAIPVWQRFLPQRLWWEKTACFAAALSPILMFALGIDYLRWSSLIVTNLLVATLTLLGLGATSPVATRRSSQQISRQPRTIWSVLLPGLFYIFLAFPQSTGVANYRIPDEFRCEHLNRWSSFLRDRVLGERGCELSWSHLHGTTAR
jgi:hypothetical protein